MDITTLVIIFLIIIAAILVVSIIKDRAKNPFKK